MLRAAMPPGIRGLDDATYPISDGSDAGTVLPYFQQNILMLFWLVR